jgi:hypothetical protein
MLILFQFLFSVFVLLAIISVWNKKNSGLLSRFGTSFWIMFWFLSAVFVWYPNSLTILANAFGIGRGTDLVLYVSLMVIFFILFRLHIKIESIGRDITKVVRKESLDDKKI